MPYTVKGIIVSVHCNCCEIKNTNQTTKSRSLQGCVREQRFEWPVADSAWEWSLLDHAVAAVAPLEHSRPCPILTQGSLLICVWDQTIICPHSLTHSWLTIRKRCSAITHSLTNLLSALVFHSSLLTYLRTALFEWSIWQNNFVDCANFFPLFFFENFHFA